MKTIRAVSALATVCAMACQEPVGQRDAALPSLQLGSQVGLGSKIAFTTDRDGRDAPDEIYVMNADGTDERRLTVTATGNSLFPEWSPDGRKIAFSNLSQIYVMNADGTDLRQVATGGGAHPCWSPDGKRIAFTGPAVGGASDILVVNLDGTGLVNLTNSPGNDARPDWSPDGRHIAFNSNRDGNPEIYVINADGSGGTVRLTFNPATDMAADWSPNGQQITFESSRDGNREIYVMNADGTDQVRLTFDPRLDAFPSWSPDGRRIAFHRQLMVIPGLDSPNGSELFAINADGTGETQLTHRTPGSFSAFASWGQGHASEPAGSPAVELQADPSVAASAPVVVMSGLDNPRGLAFGPEGALYVAEAGRGGSSPCITGPVGGVLCFGPTGAVSRLWNGHQERVATGLPSIAGSTGVAQAGPNDIAFLGRGGAYVTIGLQTDPAARSLLGEAGVGFGRLVHLPASGEWRFGTDIAAYEAANNPDGRLRDDGTPFFDSNPYGLLALPGGHLVTEAGGNALLRVDASGDISLLAVFHSRGSTPPRPSFAPSQFDQFTDAVPTSVVVGPDGAYYVAELTGVPFTDTRANVYRVVPGEPARLFRIEDACLTGFKAIIDIAFDDSGNLYVLQHSTGAVQQGGPGILIRVTPDLSRADICAQLQAGTRTIVLGGLTRPTSVAIGADGALYVTNRGISAGLGEVLRLEAP